MNKKRKDGQIKKAEFAQKVDAYTNNRLFLKHKMEYLKRDSVFNAKYIP